MADVKQKPVQITYRVLDIPHVVDGDTLWVVRERDVGPLPGMRHQAARQIGEVEGMALWAVPHFNGVGMYQVARDYAGGRAVRLHDGRLGLNTPEKSINKLGWTSARLDLFDYVRMSMRLAGLGWNIELMTYGPDKYGRLLGDIHVLGLDVSGAVAWMKDKGWEAYQ